MSVSYRSSSNTRIYIWKCARIIRVVRWRLLCHPYSSTKDHFLSRCCRVAFEFIFKDHDGLSIGIMTGYNAFRMFERIRGNVRGHRSEGSARGQGEGEVLSGDSARYHQQTFHQWHQPGCTLLSENWEKYCTMW